MLSLLYSVTVAFFLFFQIDAKSKTKVIVQVLQITSIFSSSSWSSSPAAAVPNREVELLAQITARDKYSSLWVRLMLDLTQENIIMSSNKLY